MGDYRQAISALAIKYAEVPFLDVAHYSPNPEEQKLVHYVLSVEDVLMFDLRDVGWLHTPNEASPFKGRTPYMHIVKYKKQGLLEVLVYLQALVAPQVQASKMLPPIPPLPPPPIPPYTD